MKIASHASNHEDTHGLSRREFALAAVRLGCACVGVPAVHTCADRLVTCTLPSRDEIELELVSGRK